MNTLETARRAEAGIPAFAKSMRYAYGFDDVAIVPGAFFSPFGGDWIRFSYATPAERTEGAFKRLVEGLESLKK